MAKKTKEITSVMREKADSQLNELQKEIKYDTKDYTVEVILSKMDKGEIIIPDYQRQFIVIDKTTAYSGETWKGYAVYNVIRTIKWYNVLLEEAPEKAKQEYIMKEWQNNNTANAGNINAEFNN